MDARMAVKLQDTEQTKAWYDRGISNRNSQLNSVKKSPKDERKCEGIITKSLAEVYEKALANVLNIQPNVNMDDKPFYHKNVVERKLSETFDTRHSMPPEVSTHAAHKHPYLRPSGARMPSQGNVPVVKKINTTTKSAFHVPEKRHAGNGLMRPPNWSPEVRFSYPVNYPGDYYPVVNPAVFYSRGSPYHGAFFDRMGFYSAPRGHEYPVFSHVLPWTPFERDYKPRAPPRYREWRAKEVPKSLEKDAKISREVSQKNGVGSVDKLLPKPPNRAEKTADTGGKSDTRFLSSWKVDMENEKIKFDRNQNANSRAGNVDCKVKTRRMRAFEKRKDYAKENKKSVFESPKEEFLFCLGLTKVH